MNIKVIRSCSGLSFSFHEGETADVDAELAKDLISAGFAEEIKAAPKPKNTQQSAGDKDAKA